MYKLCIIAFVHQYIKSPPRHNPGIATQMLFSFSDPAEIWPHFGVKSEIQPDKSTFYAFLYFVHLQSCLLRRTNQNIGCK